MRRKKKLLLNILKVLVVVGIVAIIYFAFFKQKKKIDTVDTKNETGKPIELVPVNGTPKEVELPENIYSVDNSTSESTDNTTTNTKTYKPSTESSDKYLISILANNEVTLLIGNDSEKLISEGSPIQIGAEYKVNGIESTLKAAYCFNVDGYDYPILLLLSQDGIVRYVDTEEGYKTGIFNVVGRLSGIPTIEKIYETTVEENGENYASAILVGSDDQGYEFKLSMIGK